MQIAGREVDNNVASAANSSQGTEAMLKKMESVKCSRKNIRQFCEKRYGELIAGRIFHLLEAAN